MVEQAVNRKSELVLKTMYKSNGDYKDNNAYKNYKTPNPLRGNHRSSSSIAMSVGVLFKNHK
ncbi:hypothetical protein ID0576_14290 [Helicobacter pylori]